MTTTNTETATKRFPAWAGKAGLWASILVATQIPSLFKTAIAAGRASDHVCEKLAQGQDIQTIVNGMQGDRRFHYSKRWEPVARALVNHNLRSCPAVASAIQTLR